MMSIIYTVSILLVIWALGISMSLLIFIPLIKKAGVLPVDDACYFISHILIIGPLTMFCGVIIGLVVKSNILDKLKTLGERIWNVE